MTDNYCSEREAAEKVGISRPTLRKYKKLGMLKPIETRHSVLYSQADLENFKAWFYSPSKNMEARNN